MIVNGSTLLEKSPIEQMEDSKIIYKGLSYGLSGAGYDIRIDREITFSPGRNTHTLQSGARMPGMFALTSSRERFTMPEDLVGVVHDKSTWARMGLSVQNTVVEPGWEGYLTLELMYNGIAALHIPAGMGIAQILFHRVLHNSKYEGKYQCQEDGPQEAIYE